MSTPVRIYMLKRSTIYNEASRSAPFHSSAHNRLTFFPILMSLLLAIGILLFARPVEARDRVEPFPFPATIEAGRVIVGGSSSYSSTDRLVEDSGQFTRSSASGYIKLSLLNQLALGASYTYYDAKFDDPEIKQNWMRGEPTFFARIAIPVSANWWITTTPTLTYHADTSSSQTQLDPAALNKRIQWTYDLPLHIFYKLPGGFGAGLGGYYQSAEIVESDFEISTYLRAAWQGDYRPQTAVMGHLFYSFSWITPFLQVEQNTARMLSFSPGFFYHPLDWLGGWLMFDYNALRPGKSDIATYAPRPPWKFSAAIELSFAMPNILPALPTFPDSPPEPQTTTEDERKSGLRVTVTDVEGTPIKNASVEISGTIAGQTTEDGTFYWEGFAAGNALVAVIATSFIEHQQLVRLYKGSITDLAVVLAYTPSARINIAGSIKDEAGNTLIGYVSNAEDPSSIIFPDLNSGEFKTYLAPDNYRLLAVVQGYEPYYRDVTAPVQGVARVDFVLKRQTESTATAMLNLNKKRIEISERILFEFGKSRLVPSSFSQLNRVADVLRSNPKVSIVIEGHTDEIGDSSYNLKLSLERAQSVGSYLRSVGVPAERMQTIGHGKDKPLCDTPDDACRERNRRVEFIVR